MKQIYLLFASLILVFIVSSKVLAQSNILDVPASTQVGYLNDFIKADTTATGARKDPNRIYRLQRASIYWISTEIITKGWDLTIIGADEDPAKPSYPPIIAYGVMADGRNAQRVVSADGNLTVKNIYFSGINQKDVAMNTAFELYKDGAKLVIDKCYFEYFKVRVWWGHAKNLSITMTNSYCRNLTNNSGPFNGRVSGQDDLVTKEVILQNNTFLNVQSMIFSIRFNSCGYFKFDHNTVVNEVKWPLHYEYHTNAEITNNIFYNVNSYGESNADASNQDIDKLQFGIINMYAVPDSILSPLKIKEADRKVIVRNNLFFTDAEVTAWHNKWNTGADPVRKPIWMNSRTEGMFNDKVKYPNLSSSNLITEDPKFTKVPAATKMIQYMEDRRAKGSSTIYYYYDEDTYMIANSWPLPEKLTYSTTSKAYTAGDKGLPLGDLNWYPDKKAAWLTDVKDINVIPTEFSLEQNYPNPFNPSTRIKFNISENANVKLRVFNILGQEVITLVNEFKNAGQHSVDFNAKELSSGVYIYKIEAGKFNSAKKMLLIK